MSEYRYQQKDWLGCCLGAASKHHGSHTNDCQDNADCQNNGAGMRDWVFVEFEVI